ncbi:nucleotide exchange factor GrpE [Allorhodopirellula solitaria]|uniref:Protein GrpE n=1 Tax=Allorhodopirellula solitaria TaxID=2527987 RepID=A0A5C5XSY7_9BACT|nr:nucleotide exchange factor GrpE [Allorhodopirellula solitaria]TWT66034.1 heat shock protein GrpE [Allorhodopirellula solitaria]
MNETESQPEDDVDFGDEGNAEAAIDQAHEAADAPETRDEEMIRLRGEVEAADKRVLQAQADAENFRKRLRRDSEDQLKFAALPLVGDILQVRDNLQRAIDAATSDSAAGLRDGVAMVVKQLDDTLAKYGVEPIPADGELFDPNFHEAISQMPHPEVEAGNVAHVAVGGYRMHGRVIRPAQVVVSTGAP